MTQKHLIRAALVAACLASGSAMAVTMDPLPLAVGASGAVPVYNGRTPTTTNLIEATCGYFSGNSCSVGTSTSDLKSVGEEIVDSTGGFIEAAGTTDLNPLGTGDVALAFIFGGTGVSDIKSVTLSGLAGYSTDVEACGPIFGSTFEGCAAGSAGNAAHSAGAGDSITFTSLGLSSIFGIFPDTDGYVVYTNAPVSALIDPSNFLTVDLTTSTTALGYAGFGLTPPSTGSMPEPGTPALLGVGLLALGFGLARRRLSRH